MGSISFRRTVSGAKSSGRAEVAKGAAMVEQAPQVPAERVEIETADGYTLVGHHFRVSAPKATVVVHAATSVPASFYHRFAAFLAGEGYSVLCYDYRGIGASRQGSLRGLDVDKVRWSRQDMSAAFEWMEAQAPGVPRFVLGHSVGGQMHGLTKRPQDIDGIVTIGTGFGYWGEMSAPYRYMVAFMWWVTIPLLTRVFGYLPSKSLGFGEDLPSGAARQWARWGKRADYFRHDLRHEEGFLRVRAPWLALRATDDAITSPQNAHAFYEAYPNADIEERVLEPDSLGLKRIDHLDFFRRANASLWPQVSDWFDAQL